MSAISKKALLLTEGLSITALSVSKYFCLQSHSIDYVLYFCLNFSTDKRRRQGHLARDLDEKTQRRDAPGLNAPRPGGGRGIHHPGAAAGEPDGQQRGGGPAQPGVAHELNIHAVTQGQQQMSRTGSNGAGDLLNRVSPMNLTFTPWPSLSPSAKECRTIDEELLYMYHGIAKDEIDSWVKLCLEVLKWMFRSG